MDTIGIMTIFYLSLAGIFVFWDQKIRSRKKDEEAL